MKIKNWIEKNFKTGLIILLSVALIFVTIFSVVRTKEVNAEVDFNSPEFAAWFDDYVNAKVDERLANIDKSKRLVGTVTATSGGSVTVVLANDETSTPVVVQNPNEIPIEIGDQVGILAVGGSLSNAIVEYRKTITLDDIYVDYTDGTDAYGFDVSGYQYGSEDAPFKTLQYAMRRLPKNLNNRSITITIVDAPSGGGDSVIYTDGFYSGYLIIQGEVGNYAEVKDIFLNNCSAGITFKYLTPKNTSGLYLMKFGNCSYIDIENCDFTTVETAALLATASSSVYLRNCTISNQTFGGVVVSTNSRVFLNDCTGSNPAAILYIASGNSSVGVYNIDNPPITGASSTSNDGTSTILIQDDYTP